VPGARRPNWTSLLLPANVRGLTFKRTAKKGYVNPVLASRQERPDVHIGYSAACWLQCLCTGRGRAYWIQRRLLVAMPLYRAETSEIHAGTEVVSLIACLVNDLLSVVKLR